MTNRAVKPKVWHIRAYHRSRAFYKPSNYWLMLIIYIRGWLPFNDQWWSKAPHKKRIRKGVL